MLWSIPTSPVLLVLCTCVPFLYAGSLDDILLLEIVSSYLLGLLLLVSLPSLPPSLPFFLRIGNLLKINFIKSFFFPKKQDPV